MTYWLIFITSAIVGGFILFLLFRLFLAVMDRIFQVPSAWDYQRAERYLEMYNRGEDVPEFGIRAIQRIPHMKDFPTEQDEEVRRLFKEMNANYDAWMRRV